MSNLQIIEYQFKRVLTTQQLATAYETETNNIKNNFANNKDRFIENRDYYLLQGEELKAFKSEVNSNDFAPNLNKLYLWTERGANRHCKILDTNKAWEQFDALEETYFQVKSNIPETIDKMISSPEFGIKLLTALQSEQDRNKILAIQVAQDKPKVLFADSVAASHTTILIGELAKILKQNGVDIGQNRLFEKLRNTGFLISRKGTDYNMPTQKSMDMELFNIKETSITHSDGHVSVSKTTKVTGKGQVYFVNKFLNKESQTA